MIATTTTTMTSLACSDADFKAAISRVPMLGTIWHYNDQSILLIRMGILLTLLGNACENDVDQVFISVFM